MSWFKKKKVAEDDTKESSVLTIETMHEDLEKNLIDSNDKEISKKGITEKPEKTSPFLTGIGSQKDQIASNSKPKEERAEETKEEPLQEPVSIKNNTPPPISKDENSPISKIESRKNIDIAKIKEEDIIPEEKNPFEEMIEMENALEEKMKTEKLPKEELEEETEEDKMEKIVKASAPNNKPPTPKEIVPEVDPLVDNKSEVSEVSKANEINQKKEDSVYIDRTRQEANEATSSYSKKENSSQAIANGFSPISRKGGSPSPFNVPSPKKPNSGGEDLPDKDKGESTVVKDYNKPLLILAVIVFVLTIVAVGTNYYRNKKQEPAFSIPQMLTTVGLNNPDYKTDNLADKGIVLKTSKELLLSDLKAFIKKEKAINPAKFIGGQFIRPLQKGTEYITAAEILQIFGSNDPAITKFLDEPVLLFITEEVVDVEVPSNNSDQNELTSPEIKTSSVMKVALVLEIKNSINPGDAIERLTEIETTFPGTLKSLMLEEDIKIANEKIVFNQASPERKDLVHAVRYYNFKYGNVTRSIEWGSLLYKKNSYIFFSTSKEATNSLIKALN